MIDLFITVNVVKLKTMRYNDKFDLEFGVRRSDESETNSVLSNNSFKFEIVRSPSSVVDYYRIITVFDVTISQSVLIKLLFKKSGIKIY